MIDFKHVDRWNLGYEMLRRASALLIYRIYYKRVQFVNMDRIPDDRPIIFALNHQNALLDALIVIQFRKRYQVTMLARADIFKKDGVAKFLRWIKIMPVFRIRDGAANLGKNDAIFERTADILKVGNKIGMMPEGNHGDKKRIRKLNKGLCRIAFKAQEKWEDKPGVVVMPVGIDYSHYRKFRSNALIRFGEPIEVSEYWNRFKENQAQTFNEFISDFREAILKEVIHIETDDYYDNYQFLNEMHNLEIRKHLVMDKKWSLNAQFEANKKLVEKLDELQYAESKKFTELNELVDRYKQNLKKHKYNDRVIRKNNANPVWPFLQTILQILAFPIYLFGAINNYIPFALAKNISNSKIKDPQFVASVRYVLSLILHPLFILLVILPLTLVFLPKAWMAAVYIFFIPLTGKFAFEQVRWLKQLLMRWKFIFHSLFRKKLIQELADQRKQIKDIVLPLFN
jgi:1-acyl-sn-glycerol-3-phosphate acyltransferase